MAFMRGYDMTTTVKGEIDFSDEAGADDLAPVRKMVQACIQCGTCTGSCPNEFAMDVTPRRLWRLVLTGQKEEIFQSKTFTLCSSCYYCTLRCPRGLPLTEAMGALKQMAAREGLSQHRQSILFYKSFMESVRRHGRVREMEFMTLYFNAMKNPLLPLRFAALGIKLMLKGKVHLQIPSKGDGALAALFRKAEELEEAP
jgi:heterodisulfide reductase subunit C